MNVVEAATAEEWRAWLARNSGSAREVWLVLRHKDSGTPGVRYEEAIEQALCFGWIDGLHRRHDAASSRLRFTPRSPRSTWSRVNRLRAARMVEQGLMTERGAAVIEAAKAAGRWETDAEMPADLLARLADSRPALENFERFPPSSRRLILEWIAGARKPETRQRRIDRTVALAAVNLRANHPGTATAHNKSR